MKKGAKDKYQRYVKLDDDMTDSAAWTALSDGAIWVYIELRKQFNFMNGGNSRLILPYSQVSWRMNSSTFSKRLKELIDYGFIRRAVKGGLFKNPNVYALSERWKEKSIEIVDKEGREAIRSGLARKPSFRNNLKNIKKLRRKKR